MLDATKQQLDASHAWLTKQQTAANQACWCQQDLYKFCGVAFILQLSIFCLFMGTASKYSPGAQDATLRTVDVFIAAVPTGIPTVLVFSLGTRIRQLKRKKIDILQVDKIKIAAATEVVCFDKTGTLTTTVVSILWV